VNTLFLVDSARQDRIFEYWKLGVYALEDIFHSFRETDGIVWQEMKK